MRVHDVVVVGAGPAGSALGTFLAQAGLDVLLVDKARFPRDKVCGDLVSAKALAMLDQLGCLDAVVSHGYTPITSASVYLNEAEFSHARLPHVPGQSPHGHAVPRVVLDEIIFRRAQAVGAETLEDCRVESLQIERNGVTIEATVSGRPERLAARLVVGADGAQSVVARAVGLAMEDARYVIPALRTYCRGVPFHEAILYLDDDFFPGYAWIFPIEGELSNVGVGMLKEPLTRHRLGLKDFFGRLARFVEAWGARLDRPVTLEHTVGWPIKTYGGARRNYFERGLLVGDAGCFVDPVSGEGIPLALETARLASETIQDALARDDCSVASLASYERRWRARYDADLKLADLVVSLARNRHLAKVWIKGFRLMGMTATTDADYADTLGGIMAGLVPTRAGLSLDVMLKSLAHGPRFWMDVLGVTSDRPWEGFARLLGSTAQMLQDSFDDFEWSRSWALEVQGKWLEVLRRRA
jgi:geranylgeranyl reductase family protein